MRDFYPEDMPLRASLFDTWKAVSERFGFVPYDACVVESLDLLKRKAGEEIVHQIYAFQDKSGRDLALRPEMTPTLARMVASRQGAVTFPLKWYTIAQCFRYERMTRGRKREHFQWNLDIIGEPSVHAEIEIIAAAVQALHTLGLKPGEFFVHYNSRKLLAELLVALGIRAELHAAAFLALDKRGKITDEEMTDLLRQGGLAETDIASVFKLLDLRDFAAASALLAPDSAARAELAQFENLVRVYGLEGTVRFDISVVRGLSYYTGIVFEAFDANRAFRAIFGGGRYDNLLRDVGGKPQTGVGLGFGDVVVSEILVELGHYTKRNPCADLLVGFMEESQRATAAAFAMERRRLGEKTDLCLAPEKPKFFFARAGKNNYRKAVYLGPDDLVRGTARLKDLASRAEEEVPLPKV